MTSKEYLKQIRQLKTTIQNLENRISDMRAQESTLRSAWPDGQPHGSGASDPTGNKAVKLADELMRMEDDVLHWQRELFHKQLEITEMLSRLDKPEHNRLLYLRYVENQTWEEIAVDMHYTYRWVTSLHGQALQEFDRVLNSSY